MSPPTKRVSKKSTPAASRLRANNTHDSDDSESDRYDMLSLIMLFPAGWLITIILFIGTISMMCMIVFGIH